MDSLLEPSARGARADRRVPAPARARARRGVAGWLLAKAARFALVKALRAINFNVLTERAGLDEFLRQGGIRSDTTDIFGVLVYWLIVLAALVLAFNTLGLDLHHRSPAAGRPVRAAAHGRARDPRVRRLLRALHRRRRAWPTAATSASRTATLLGRLAQYAILAFVVLIALEQMQIGGDIVRTASSSCSRASCSRSRSRSASADRAGRRSFSSAGGRGTTASRREHDSTRQSRERRSAEERTVQHERRAARRARAPTCASRARGVRNEQESMNGPITAVWPGRPYPRGATWDGEGVNFALFSRARRESRALPLRRERAARGPAHRAHGAHRPGLALLSARSAAGAALRLSRARALPPRAGPPLQPAQAAARPLRESRSSAQVNWSDAHFGYRVGHEREDLSFDRRDSAPACRNAASSIPRSPGATTAGPNIPWHDTVIYELHVKGFTMRHPDVPPRAARHLRRARHARRSSSI